MFKKILPILIGLSLLVAVPSHASWVLAWQEAADIAVDASSFTGNLSTADTTLQAALATIDAVALGGDTTETNQDDAWDVLTGTQTLITVTYQDGDGEVDFVVDDDLSLYDWSSVDGTDLKTGSVTQAYDASLTSLAALATAADKMVYTTAADTYAEADLTAFGRSILDDADEATFKATVNLEIGTDVQAWDDDLDDLAALAHSDGNIIVSDGTDWVVESGATAQASLGLVIGTNVQAYDADLDDLADGTLSASKIEFMSLSAETTIDDADSVWVYDDSASAYVRMTRGNFVFGLGGGGGAALDLLDDGSNESSGITEIAVQYTGAAATIASEPSANKLLFDFGLVAQLAENEVITGDWDFSADPLDDADVANDLTIDGGAIGSSPIDDSTIGGVTPAAGTFTTLTANSTLTVATGQNIVLGANTLNSGDLLDGTKVADADLGDVGVSSGVWSVENDSHAHTNSTITLASTDLTDTANISLLDANQTITGTRTFSGEVTMGADLNLNAHEIQSTGNITLQLGNNDGTSYVEIQDSGGGLAFRFHDDGTVTTTSSNDPYSLFNEDDASSKFATRHNDDTTDAWELGYVAAAQTEVTDANFTELLQVDINGDMALAAGGITIPTGETYKVNGTQISLANLSDGAAHASRHIQSGADEIDGDLIDIDYAQTNYTPATTGVATDVNQLAAHLEGIDNALGASGTGTIAGMTDTDFGSLSGGQVMLWDGSDDWENKALSGDIASVGTDGTVTIANDAITMAKLDEDGNFTDWVGNWTFATGTVTFGNGIVLGSTLNLGAAALIDATGAVDIDFGSADITDFTFTSASETITFTGGAITGVTSITAGAAEINGTITLANDETIVNSTDGTIGFTGDAVDIPSGANPDTGAEGEMAIDSDDNFIEFYGSAVRVVGSEISESFTLRQPDDLQSESDDLKLKKFVAEAYPHGVEITSIHVDCSEAISDTLLFQEWDDNAGSTQATVESIALSTAATAEDDGVDDGTMAADSFLVVNLDDAQDDISEILITITYYIIAGD
jgi:hypothetical protein